MSVATLTVCARSRHQECLARIVRVNVCADGIEINFFFLSFSLPFPSALDIVILELSSRQPFDVCVCRLALGQLSHCDVARAANSELNL